MLTHIGVLMSRTKTKSTVQEEHKYKQTTADQTQVIIVD